MLLRTRQSRVIDASKLSVKAFVPLALVSSSLFALSLSLMVMLDCGSTTFLGLHVNALSDLEMRMATEQRTQEATTELMALTNSRQAMCDVMFGASLGST